jgi:hypothetical protein
MDIQNIIVALVILAAFGYAGQRLWRRVKSFAPKKSSCAADCGCGNPESQKMPAQIKR